MRVLLERVTKRFDQLTVVDEVSLEIADGELFFLLGTSGCGKTTLLRCVAGFCVPDNGTIRIGERDVTHLAPHERDTGMVFQSYALWPHLTVRENVAFGLEVRKVPKTDRERRVQEALALVQMSDRAEQRPNQLSGGQQQRVALARALVVRPTCLLLDEPLSNLDAKLRLEMRTEIRRICKEAGLTAIYVTHDQKEALSIADRLAVMHGGKLEQCGTPREVYERPVDRFVAGFIGESNFLEGELAATVNGRVEVKTAQGPLVRTGPLSAVARVGDRVTVSIRPEVLHLGEPPGPGMNVFRGVAHDTTYLGELAQHLVDVGGAAWKVLELQPKLLTRDGTKQPVALWCRTEDVVVLER